MSELWPDGVDDVDHGDDVDGVDEVDRPDGMDDLDADAPLDFRDSDALVFDVAAEGEGGAESGVEADALEIPEAAAATEIPEPAGVGVPESTDADAGAALDAGDEAPAGAELDAEEEADAGKAVVVADAPARPEFEPTGDTDVDEVLAGLADLDGSAPADHIERYDDAHRRLHEILIGASESTPTAPDDDNGA